MPEEPTPIYGSLVSMGGSDGAITFSTGTGFTSLLVDCRDVASVGQNDFAIGAGIGQSQMWLIGYSILVTQILAGALAARAATQFYVSLETWFSSGLVAAFGLRQIAYLPVKIATTTVGEFRAQGDGARLNFNNFTGADFEIWWRAWAKAL